MASNAVHKFHAVAFESKAPPKELARVMSGATRVQHCLRMELHSGTLYAFSSGALVFVDVPEAARDEELGRFAQLSNPFGKPTVRDDLVVCVDPSAEPRVESGRVTLDALSPERAATVAETLAQSVAMEWYEAVVGELFARTADTVAELGRRGTMRLQTARLHRFIAEVANARNEVLTVLHLLDKPDATWDDPTLDRLWVDLREEFDLTDRHASLEAKIRAIQESLELVLDVARDRRLVLLESAIVLLIVLEIVLGLTRLV